MSVAVLNNMIYAMGGSDGYHRQNTAERYDYKRNQWSLIKSMNSQRSDASATTLNGIILHAYIHLRCCTIDRYIKRIRVSVCLGKIYIAGGYNGSECIRTAEVYDPVTDQWTAIAPMRSRRSGVSCIAYHGSVYAIGICRIMIVLQLAEEFSE